jgi:2-oxoglutarate dehydrogenase E2 component (dihydrolipoamide succinyltransferase)
MPQVELILPKMGESIFEATVIKWLKKEGEKVEKDESILEVATDKVDTEVPAIQGGILEKILVKEGEVAQIGSAIAIINTQTGANNEQSIVQKIEQSIAQIQTEVSATSRPVTEGRFYSPLVLNIAKEEKIPMSELEKIPGTGKDGRVTKHDILQYIEDKKSGKLNINTVVEQIPNTTQVAAPKTEQTGGNESKSSIPKDTTIPKPQVYNFSGEYEVVEMDRMRKIIAQRMIESQRISATVTSFIEADVTNLVYWRGKVKHEFMKREGEGITFTPLIVEAIAKALKEYPLMNSSIDGENIIIKKDINIGIAVALPDGNLIVPVVKNADRYNLVGLTKYVNELIKKAKNNQLKPTDLQDGTYTLSTIGGFGNVMGTPVIMQPQVGILAAGAIKKKPAVIETDYGDTIGIRHFMFLSHSYDHRIIDGSLGGSFVKKVADLLENFDVERKLF